MQDEKQKEDKRRQEEEQREKERQDREEQERLEEEREAQERERNRVQAEIDRKEKEKQREQKEKERKARELEMMAKAEADRIAREEQGASCCYVDLRWVAAISGLRARFVMFFRVSVGYWKNTSVLFTERLERSERTRKFREEQEQVAAAKVNRSLFHNLLFVPFILFVLARI